MEFLALCMESFATKQCTSYFIVSGPQKHRRKQASRRLYDALARIDGYQVEFLDLDSQSFDLINIKSSFMMFEYEIPLDEVICVILAGSGHVHEGQYCFDIGHCYLKIEPLFKCLSSISSRQLSILLCSDCSNRGAFGLQELTRISTLITFTNGPFTSGAMDHWAARVAQGVPPDMTVKELLYLYLVAAPTSYSNAPIIWTHSYIDDCNALLQAAIGHQVEPSTRRELSDRIGCTDELLNAAHSIQNSVRAKQIAGQQYGMALVLAIEVHWPADLQ